MKQDIINTKINQVFKIQLGENPSTGSRWILSKLPTNIYLIDDSYIADDNPEGMVGKGGTRTFVFKSISEGKNCEIQFQNMRIWEHTSFETKAYIVNVSNAVKYERITDYFVNNTYMAGRHHLIIDSKEKFDEVFSPAPLMYKEQRWIQESDFVNNIVTAIVMPAESKITEFTIEGVEENNKKLNIKYAIHQEDITWTARCCMILLVEKASYNEVIFYEADQKQAELATNIDYSHA